MQVVFVAGLCLFLCLWTATSLTWTRFGGSRLDDLRLTCEGFRWYYNTHGHWSIPKRYQIPESDETESTGGIKVEIPASLKGLKIGARWQGLRLRPVGEAYAKLLQEYNIPVLGTQTYDARPTIDGFLWYFATYGNWFVPVTYQVPNNETVIINNRTIIIPEHIRGINLGDRWHSYMAETRYKSSVNEFITSGIPPPQTARELFEEWKAAQSSLQTFANAVLWFTNAFGHFDIPSKYRVPNEDTIVIKEQDRVMIPDRIRGFALGKAWKRYMDDDYRTADIEALEQYGLPERSLVQKLIRFHRLDAETKPVTLPIAAAIRWFISTHGHANVPWTYSFPTEAIVEIDGKSVFVPDAIRGLSFDRSWNSFALGQSYDELLEDLQPEDMLDAHTAQQMIEYQRCALANATTDEVDAGQKNKRTKRNRNVAQLIAACRWYFDTFGHWDIPNEYIIPSQPIAFLGDRTVEVPEQVRGMYLGSKWKYIRRGGYITLQSDFVQAGIPNPFIARALTQQQQQEAKASGRRLVRGMEEERRVNVTAAAFRWFFETYGHWDIPLQYVIPDQSELVQGKKAIVIPETLRAMKVGYRWDQYIRGLAYKDWAQVMQQNQVPDPVLATKLIQKTAQRQLDRYRRMQKVKKSGKDVQSSWLSKVYTTANAFRWFFDTYGHWSIPRSFSIPNQPSVLVPDKGKIKIPEEIRGLNVGERWASYLSGAAYSTHAEQFKALGIPDVPTAKQLVHDRQSVKSTQKLRERVTLAADAFHWFQSVFGQDVGIPRSYRIPDARSLRVNDSSKVPIQPRSLRGYSIGMQWSKYLQSTWYDQFPDVFQSRHIPPPVTARLLSTTQEGKKTLADRRARQTIDAFVWFHETYGHWAIPKSFSIPNQPSVKVPSKGKIKVPNEIRGLRVGARWASYLSGAAYSTHAEQFQALGIPDVPTAKQLMKDSQVESLREKVTIAADAFHWFQSAFGQDVGIPRSYRIPDTKSLRVNNSCRLPIQPRTLRGFPVGGQWSKYLQSTWYDQFPDVFQSRHIPPPATARLLSTAKLIKKTQRDSERDWKARQIIDAFVWFHKVHGHWAIPQKYCILNATTTQVGQRTVSIPEHIRGLLVGQPWLRYLQGRSLKGYRDYLQSKHVPEPAQATKLIAEHRTKDTLLRAADAFQWYGQTFGNYFIPTTYHIPTTNTIVVNDRKVQVPKHLRGFGVGIVWRRKYLSGSWFEQYIELFTTRGIPSPATVQQLLQQAGPAEKWSNRVVQMRLQRARDAFLWFHRTHRTWDIPKDFIIPNASTVFDHNKNKSINIAEHIRGFPVGETWLQYFYSRGNKFKKYQSYFTAAKKIPVPQMTTKHQQIAVRREQEKAMKMAKEEEQVKKLVQPFRWFHDTFGHWIIPLTYVIPNKASIRVGNVTVYIPRACRGVSVGIKWYNWYRVGGYRAHVDRFAAEGIPDRETARRLMTEQSSRDNRLSSVESTTEDPTKPRRMRKWKPRKRKEEEEKEEEEEEEKVESTVVEETGLRNEENPSP